MGFPGGVVIKNLPASVEEAGDMDLAPALGRSPGNGNGYPLQYSCLGNTIRRGAWRAIVHEVTKNPTLLSNCAHTHTHMVII